MNLPLAPLFAAVAGGLAALAVTMIPGPALEALVMDSGLPSVLSASEPPLGLTARLALALGTGGFVAAFIWLSAFILLGSRGLTIGGADAPADPEQVPLPVLRRADAHPDAPPRPPLLATRDLGKPFLEVHAAPAKMPEDDHIDFDKIFPPRRATSAPASAVPSPEPAPIVAVRESAAERPEVGEAYAGAAPMSLPELPTRHAPLPLPAPSELPLPTDFDQPLSAFDPAAIPAVPKPAPVPLAPLRRTPRPSIFDESERFEIFELTPPVRPAPPPAAVASDTPTRDRIVRPETDASIHALLDRLERGVADKGLAPTYQPKAAERGLEEALVTLRNLARRTA